MCFSPTASFTASASLAAIGTVSIIYSRTVPQRIFAGIPIVFAIQQFTEGILWLALLHPAYASWEKTTTYAFLIFAQVIWPIYIPISVLLLERKKERKKILYIFSAIGILLGVYLGYTILLYNVQVIAADRHIKYMIGSPIAKQWFFGVLYIIPTILAPVFSGTKRVRLIGWGFLLCYLISRLLFQYYVISVWCFFSALLSLIVLYIILKIRNTPNPASA